MMISTTGPFGLYESKSVEIEWAYFKYKEETVAMKVADCYALECIRCKYLAAIAECSNCGNDEFTIAPPKSGGTGIFCTRCELGSSRWICPNCRTNNPVKVERFCKYYYPKNR